MSKQNLQKFYQVFRLDLSLQEELSGITDSDEYVQQTVDLGLKSGFEFTTDDVRAALKAPGKFLEETIGEELTDAELAFSGGGGGDMWGNNGEYCKDIVD